MKGYLKVFIAAFPLSAVLATFSNTSKIEVALSRSPTLPSLPFYFGILINALFVTALFLVFVAYYSIGKKIDLIKQFWTVSASLAIGSWLGYMLIYSTVTFYYAKSSGVTSIGGVPVYAEDGWALLSRVIASGLTSVTLQVFSSAFFLALAAFGIAYIRLRKPAAVEKPSDLMPQLNEKDVKFSSIRGKAVPKVSLVAFLLAIPFSIFSNMIFLVDLFSRSSSIDPWIWLGFVLNLGSVGSFVLCPIVFFVVFYFVGRAVDLAAKLRFVVVPLVFSCFLGYIITYGLLAYVFAINSGGANLGAPSVPLQVALTMILANIPPVMVNVFLRVLSTVFFVALAALAMASTRKIKNDTDAQGQPNC